MSSAYLMNVSQTNNALLQNRVNQLTLQNNQLKKQIAEIESNQQDSAAVIKNYAKQFTTNNTSSSQAINIQIVFPTAQSWKAQTCVIRNIKLISETKTTGASTETTYNLVINLSDPFAYITAEDRETVSAINIPLTSCSISEDTPIDQINTISVASNAGIPFTSNDLFAILESSNDTKTIYNLGSKEGNVIAEFDSSTTTGAKLYISSARWIVYPQ